MNHGNIIAIGDYLKNNESHSNSTSNRFGKDDINLYALLKYLKKSEFRSIIFNAILFYSEWFPNALSEIFKLEKNVNVENINKSSMDGFIENPTLLELCERLVDNPDVAELFLLQLKRFDDKEAASL